MKVLGRTPQAGTIIEFDARESHLLEMLQEAIEGREWTLEMVTSYNLPQDMPMDKMFIAMRYFIEANFAVNSLRSILERLESAVNGDGKE